MGEGNRGGGREGEEREREREGVGRERVHNKYNLLLL